MPAKSENMVGAIWDLYDANMQSQVLIVYIPKCRFEDLLRALTVEKADICEAMAFALDNAECAFEVGRGMTRVLRLPPTFTSEDPISHLLAFLCVLLTTPMQP